MKKCRYGKSIESVIELKRKELIKTGLKHGFNSNKTLVASQQLDALIIEYQKSNQ